MKGPIKSKTPWCVQGFKVLVSKNYVKRVLRFRLELKSAIIFDPSCVYELAISVENLLFITFDVGVANLWDCILRLVWPSSKNILHLAEL